MSSLVADVLQWLGAISQFHYRPYFDCRSVSMKRPLLSGALAMSVALATNAAAQDVSPANPSAPPAATPSAQPNTTPVTPQTADDPNPTTDDASPPFADTPAGQTSDVPQPGDV